MRRERPARGPRLTSKRLDTVLVERGLAPTRSRARDMVLRGTVRIDGTPAVKPSQSVAVRASVTTDDPAGAYVSRAALKLVAALDAHRVPVAGRHALDLGASTGGFTQVLLERGASHVIALDVGHDQLHPSLRADARTTVIEGANARDLTAAALPFRPDLVVSDMSFISLDLAATPALRLAVAGAWAVLLVKPQFEMGRDWIGKGGLVRAHAPVEAMLRDRQAWVEGLPGWRCVALEPAPIAGADGNREYLMVARHEG